MASKVDIVVLSWNRKDDTLETLRSLKQQNYPDFNITVVDNNSSDGVADAIEQEFSEVNLIRLPKNLGVAGGRNVGIKNCTGDIVFFLDNDALLASDALSRCVEELEKNPKIAVVTGKVVNYFTNTILDTDWVHPYDKGQFSDTSFFTPIFNGGCHAIRREVVELVGDFPDDFFRQDEEIDLCYRIIDAGYVIKYCPDIVMYHKLSPIQRSHSLQFFNSTKNNLVVVWRYLPIDLAAWQTLVRVLVLGVRALQKGFLLAYVKGLVLFVLQFPSIVKNRRPIKPGTVTNIRELWLKSNKPIYRLLW